MTRCIFTLTLILAALLLIIKPGRAQLIVGESFAYTVGTISGNNGGIGSWNGAWSTSSTTTPDQVSAGSLAYSQSGIGLNVSGNKLTTVGTDVGAYRRPQTTFGPYGGSVNQDLWISFLAQNTPGSSGAGYGGLSLFENTNNNPAAETEQLFIGETLNSQLYGFQNNSAIAVQDSQNGAQSTATAADTNVDFIVAHLGFTSSGSTEVDLYINPEPGTVDSSSNPVAYTDSTSYIYSDSFQFDQFRFQSGPTPYNFDELRMGNTYLDVAPAVPEPSPRSTLLLGFSAILSLILISRSKNQSNMSLRPSKR